MNEEHIIPQQKINADNSSYSSYHNHRNNSKKYFDIVIKDRVMRHAMPSHFEFDDAITIAALYEKVYTEFSKGFPQGGIIISNKNDLEINLGFSEKPKLSSLDPNTTLKDCLDKAIENSAEFTKKQAKKLDLPVDYFKLYITVHYIPEEARKLNTYLEQLEKQLRNEIPEYDDIQNIYKGGSGIPVINALKKIIMEIRLHYHPNNPGKGIYQLNFAKEAADLQTVQWVENAQSVFHTDKSCIRHRYSKESKAIIGDALDYICSINADLNTKMEYTNRSKNLQGTTFQPHRGEVRRNQTGNYTADDLTRDVGCKQQ